MNEGVIVFDNVCKRFDQKVILDHFSFEVGASQIFCLIGGSGSGKSLTLKILLGLVGIDAGEVYWQGEPLSGFNEKKLNAMRRQIGMVFQGSALFDSMSVFENIAYPLREAKTFTEGQIQKMVAEKLDWVGLSGIEDLDPKDLSGGMKKRVGLARAIVLNPKVILYDEPTAGLDPSNTRRIDDLILRLATEEKVTSILVTHHMESVMRIATHVALLLDKKVCFKGSAQEFKTTRQKNVIQFVQGLED